MNHHKIQIADTGESFSCRDDETALVALARSGKRGIPIGCRGGGCGVCKVEVIRGSYVARAMSRCHVSEDDERHQRVLACCIYPDADLEVRVLGGMRKAVMRCQ